MMLERILEEIILSFWALGFGDSCNWFEKSTVVSPITSLCSFKSSRISSSYVDMFGTFMSSEFLNLRERFLLICY